MTSGMRKATGACTTTMTTPRRLTTARIEATNAIGKDVWLSDNDGSRGGGAPADSVRSRSRRFYFRISMGTESTSFHWDGTAARVSRATSL